MENAQIIVFDGNNQPLRRLEQVLPVLKPEEILIKNLFTTLCGSDLHTYCGVRQEKTPTVLGHEIVGEIIAFGEGHPQSDYSGQPLKIGDRVTWTIFAADKNSPQSQVGMPQKSDVLFKYGHTMLTKDDALHGGLSTHCVLRKGTAVLKLPKDIPLPVAATINCAVATVAGALRLAGNVQNKTILITGSGLLGVICTAMCHVAGASEIHLTDVDALRLEQGKGFGASQLHLFNETLDTLPSRVDIAFDMSGSPDAMEDGLNRLDVGGIAVWVGAVFKNRNINVNAENVVRKLISIKGLHNYNFEDFATAVAFVKKHHQTYPFKNIVSKEFNLTDAEQAFRYAMENKPLRVGININGSSGTN